jgi:fibrillarin-like rRNA methylase
MSPLRYPNGSAARKDFSGFLHAAFDSQVVTVKVADQTVAVVDADVFRTHLARTVPANAQVFEEDGAVAIVLPGRPFAVESTSLPESFEEVIDVLREYAADWQARLHAAPNHDNWALVQLVELSSDEELTAWLTGSP